MTMTGREAPSIYEQKLGERLILLTNHGRGLLARLAHLKKMLLWTKDKMKTNPPENEQPSLAFLFDSQFDSAIKYLTRKFPQPSQVDQKNKDFNCVRDKAKYIQQELEPYYHTMKDIHDFWKDGVSLISSVQAVLLLDFKLHDVTTYFLELICTLFFSQMILSKVDERKSIIALYSFVSRHEPGTTSELTPLEHFIAESSDPIGKTQNKFTAVEALLRRILVSLNTFYKARTSTGAEEYFDSYNMVIRAPEITEQFHPPSMMGMPQHRDNHFHAPEAAFLSLESVEKWICVICIACPKVLEDEKCVREMWRKVLTRRYTLPLFRDINEKLHELMLKALDTSGTIKDIKKTLERDVKNAMTVAANDAPTEHKKVRLYLRHSLRINYLILSDVPGLLGLKVMLPLMLMSAARDEIHWLLHHYNADPPVKRKEFHPDLIEPNVAELLFHVESFRLLFKKYSQVVTVFHVDEMKIYNQKLAESIQQCPMLPQHESTVFSDIINKIQALPSGSDLINSDQPADFQGVRLDWIRLQTYLGDKVSDKGFFGQAGVAEQVLDAMCGIVWCSKMIDFLDNVLNDVSDMSALLSWERNRKGSYEPILRTWLANCLADSPAGTALEAAQGSQTPGAAVSFPLTKELIVFPMLCSHFTNTISNVAEYLPSERDRIGEQSLATCNLLLEEISKKACSLISDVCKLHQEQNKQLMPKNACQPGPALAQTQPGTIRRGKIQVPTERPSAAPGSESERERRDVTVTKLDQKMSLLTEILAAINHCDQIIVNRYSFSPREYLMFSLEKEFMGQIRDMVSNPDVRVKPSEMLAQLQATMSVMQNLENYVNVDMTRLFNTVLMQHSLPLDAEGKVTIAQYYSKHYIMGFMPSISEHTAVYSDHFKCFISLPPVNPGPGQKGQEPKQLFPVEEFSDITELRALAEMVGPYGIRYINEVITQQILKQFEQIQSVVAKNELKLNQAFQVLSRPSETIKIADSMDRGTFHLINEYLCMIGAFVALRELLSQALNDVLKKRVPFLMSCISGLEKPDQRQDANDLAATAGFKVQYYDPIIQNFLKIKSFEHLKPKPEDVPALVNNLIALFGLSLPYIVDMPHLPYNRHLETSPSNAMCIGKAVNCLLTMTILMQQQANSEEYIRACFQRFLGHAAGCVLRMVDGQDGAPQTAQSLVLSRKSRDTTYLVLKQIVEECPYLSIDALEAVFPYTLVRCAFHNSHLKDPPPRPARAT